ncbi:MAG TPA: DUF1801 domain-containing protein [Polyangiaceae bacterium]|nr:DUF1801 domain-containing protein [Polyangiaceae bacterium]
MAPKKKTLSRKAPAKKKTAKAAKKALARRPAPRADFGAPVDGFFARQPPALRPITDRLRQMVKRAAPAATSTIKWGMPFYAIGETMMCAIGAHASHVNLILPGAPGTYDDPRGLLTGEGKTGRHLKIRSLEELPEKDVVRFLAKAAALAKAGG